MYLCRLNNAAGMGKVLQRAGREILKIALFNTTYLRFKAIDYNDNI